MDSGNLRCNGTMRAGVPPRWAGVAAVALTLACQPSVEIDFVRPKVAGVQPVAAGWPPGTQDQLELQLVLLGSPGWWPLAARDRARVGSTIVALNELKSENFVVSLPAGEPDVSTVRYVERGRDLALALLLDNSESAARWDPEGRRLSLAAAVVSDLAAMVDAGLLDSVVLSLLELRQGQVHVVARQRSDLAAVAALPLSLSSPGGRAPLWDGVLQAGRLAVPGGGRDALVIVYWGSSGDGESVATRDQALAVARGLPVVAVRGPGGGPGPLDLAEVGGGTVLRADSGADVVGAAPVLAGLVRGAWQLGLRHGAGEGDRLAGQVSFSPGTDEAWTRAFDVPLFRR